MKRLLIEVKRPKYSVEVDTALYMKLNVSVYERMNNPQLYANIEQAIHKFIGEKVKRGTHELIENMLQRIEFESSLNFRS